MAVFLTLPYDIPAGSGGRPAANDMLENCGGPLIMFENPLLGIAARYPAAEGSCSDFGLYRNGRCNAMVF